MSLPPNQPPTTQNAQGGLPVSDGPSQSAQPDDLTNMPVQPHTPTFPIAHGGRFGLNIINGHPHVRPPSIPALPSSMPDRPTRQSVHVDAQASEEELAHAAPQALVADGITNESVNAQHDCPLFNGRIPSEIRTLIFEYAVTPAPDMPNPWDTNTHYSRPGFRCPSRRSTALLRTCRRIYLETHHLPATNFPHTFWFFRGPLNIRHVSDPIRYMTRMKPDHRALAKEMHLFTQLYWLEQSFQGICDHPALRGVEKLKLTFRRGDWWYWESNVPLAIDPYGGHADSDNFQPGSVAPTRVLNQDGTQRRPPAQWLARRMEKVGEEILSEKSWAAHLYRLANLRELVLEFETTKENQEELEDITTWARTWRFPLQGGKILSTEGQEVRTSEWLGPECMKSSNHRNGRRRGHRPHRVLVPVVGGVPSSVVNSSPGVPLVVIELTWKAKAAVSTDQ